MTDKIRVLIVDDLSTTRESVGKLLQFEPRVELIGEAATGREALAMVQEHRPDVVLMDINMPDMDGITASEHIIRTVPGTEIIIMSVQSETDYMRRAMIAGARDFLMKPFSLDELVMAIHQANERRRTATVPAKAAKKPAMTGRVADKAQEMAGHLVAVFSPKGGSGCTTVAVNVAVALARLGRRTLLVDCCLQFGDVALMLNMRTTSSIIDVIERLDDLESESLSSFVLRHPSGLDVLLAPPRPEMGDLITADHVKTLFGHLQQVYEFVIVDTDSDLSDVVLKILELSNQILLVTLPNLPSVKSTSRFFDLTGALQYDSGKVELVINGVSERTIPVKSIADALKRPVSLTIPADDLAIQLAANQGVPLVAGPAQRSPIADAIGRVAKAVAVKRQKAPEKAAEPNTVRKSFLARLIGKLFGRK